MLLNTPPRYDLRTRARVGLATQPSRDIDESPSIIDPDSYSNEEASRQGDHAPHAEATTAVRTYSDVVASRPPSPRGQRPVLPFENPTENLDNARAPDRARDESTVADDGNGVDAEGDGNIETPDKPEYSRWTRVQRKRARSESSLPNKKTLTFAQRKVVQLAEKGLTKEQQQKLQRRQEKVRPRRDSSVSSRGEGTSKRKGKAIDPREWGNINVSRESLDVEAQAAVLESYEAQQSKRLQKHSKEKKSRRKEKSLPRDDERPDHSKESTKRSKRHSGRPIESQPAAQIAPKSYLGAALKGVGRSRKTNHWTESSADSGDESPSSPSSSSTSDDETTSNSSDDESEESDHSRRKGKRRRDNRHGRNKRRKRRSSSASRTNIKPIPPKEYDGAADVRSYHRFVRESDAYLRDGKVRSRRKVSLLSHYLTGKAYDFYMQKVAIDEERWTEFQFYEELFNYCFPVDYRMQLRKTLARCHQNDKSVAEYTHELQDLFNMIGNVPKQDQVLKFWNSSRPSIQKELWRNRLNPELSSWTKVVAQAEIIEIAENVAERRDRKSGQTLQTSGGASGSGGGNSKGKQPSTDSSVRAVTFGSHRRPHGKHPRRTPQNQPDGQSRGNTPQSRGGTPGERGKSTGGSAPPSNYRPNKTYDNSNVRKTRLLSDKEKAEYRAAGRCFNCGKEGHMSRNCPDNATVKSKGSGPPGSSAFNLEPVSIVETDSEEHIEVLDSLPLGAICFGDSEQIASVMPWSLRAWRDHYPYWKEPHLFARASIGDCYAMVMDAILTLEMPYPGDHLYNSSDMHPELRFQVYRGVDDDYVIRDRLTDTRLTVARDLVKEVSFDVSRWYAEQRSRALGLTRDITHLHPIGDAIAIVTKKLLTDGIASSYPCTNSVIDPDDRFWVQQSEGRDTYIVVDIDLEVDTHIPRIWLEEPTFDLVSWYRLHLDQHEYFEQCYYEAH